MASATRLLWLDVSIGAPRSLATGDTVAAPGDWTFSEDSVISGNFFNDTATTEIYTDNVNIADRFTLHNSNYTTDTAVTAGIVFNIDPAATSFSIATASNAGLAAAGSVTAGDSGFTTTADPSATLAAGDIIIVTGANDVANDGIYEVKGVSAAPNQVAIKTAPDASVQGIVQTSVVTDATAGGTLVQSSITVIRADSTGGTMSIGSGDATPITFATIQTGADTPTTLQIAYDNGNSILTSAAEGGPVTVSTTADEANSGLTVTGGNHTGPTAQDLVVLTTDGNSTGAALQVNNAGTGEAIEILPTAPGATDQIAVVYSATAFTGLPTALNLDYQLASSFSNASDVIAANIQGGRPNGGGGDSIALNIERNSSLAAFQDGWNYGLKTDAALWLTASAPSALQASVSIYFGNGQDWEIFQGTTGAKPTQGLKILSQTIPAANTNGEPIDIETQVGGAAGGGSAAGNGGTLDLEANNGGIAGTAAGETAGTGGNVFVNAGAGGAGDATVPHPGALGGAISLVAGLGGTGAAGTTGGTGGSANLTAGSGGSAGGGTGGNGGSATVAGGSGLVGGSVTIRGGFGSGGTDGDLDLGVTNTENIAIGGANTSAVDISTGVSETLPVVDLINTTGAASLFTGTSDPSGSITGDAGSLFLRDTGSGGELYVNTSTGSGTTWSLLAAATGSVSLQSAYETGASITVSTAEGTLAISGTVDDAQTVMSLTGGAHTASTAENLLDISNDADSTGYAVQINNLGSGNALDVQDGGGSVLTVNGAGAVSLTPTSGQNATITAAGAGAVDITSGSGGVSITGAASSATAIVIDDGTNTYLTIDSVDTQIEQGQFFDTGTNVGQGLTYANNSGAAIAAGKLVATDTNTTLQVIEADATSGSATNLTSRITGVTTESIANAGTGKVNTAHGVHMNITFTGAVATSDIGKVAYLDTTGNATLTAPSASGDFVVEVGIVQGANGGAGTAARVLFMPRFVAAIA
jgi:hypothetical protein